MTTIDEKMLREFRQDFKAAVLSLEKKYGISIEAKKISYSKDSFNMVVNATVSSGNKEDDQRLAFEKLCSQYGFRKEDYGAEFTYQGKQYRFVGFDSQKRKNVCIISDTTSNVSYTCSADLVIRMISDHDEKEYDCERCANAVCKTGAYTGTQFIECGLSPHEEYYLNHPDELDWAIKRPEEAEKKYCSFRKGVPQNGRLTFDD